MTPDEFDLHQQIIAGTATYNRIKAGPFRTYLARKAMNEAKLMAWHAARELRTMHTEEAA